MDVFHYVVNVLLKRLDASTNGRTISALMAALLRALQSVAALEESDRSVLHFPTWPATRSPTKR